MTGSFLEKCKKNIRYALVPGCLIGLFMTVGYVVKKAKGFRFSLAWLVACVVACAVCVALIACLYTVWDKRNLMAREAPAKGYLPNRLFKKSWVYFLVMVALLLIVWLPALLALYPGVYAYDASWQHDMYVSGRVTEHHPVIHTYIVGWLTDTFYNLTGQFNKGVLAYTLFQEIVMALGCGFVLYLLHRRKRPTVLHVFALIFYGLYPTFVLFVFSSTKDSIFAVAVADLIFLSLDMFEHPDDFFGHKSNYVLWAVFALEITILRNNSVYAVLLTLPFLIAWMVRRHSVRFKALGMLAATIVIYLIYKYPITSAVTVDGVSKAEMLSVPSQQIMRVYTYHGDELSADDKAMVEHLFDESKWNRYYNPYIADAAKGSLTEAALDEEFGDFKALWLKLFRQYPGEYVDSVLENTYGFWYPWPTYVLHSLGGEGYASVFVIVPCEQNTKIPALFDFFKQFENGDLVMRDGFISWLFAPATFLYISLIVMFYVLKAKEKSLSIPFVYLTLLWLTFLLGPVANVRYVLYLFALVPVWPEYITSKCIKS